MAVVGAAVSVLASRAPELGHGYDHRICGQITEIGPEGGERLRELMENVGNLPLRAAFVDVMVPAADVGECDLNSEVSFDQLGELLEAVTEASFGIVGVSCRLVLGWVGGLQHLDGVECFLAGAMQHKIDRV